LYVRNNAVQPVMDEDGLMVTGLTMPRAVVPRTVPSFSIDWQLL